MLDPEGAIRAALVHIAQRDAAELAAVARHYAIPLQAVVTWIHERPRPLTFAPREFLRWAKRYNFTNAAALQTHSQIVGNNPGDAPTDPGRPQLP
jgi:hypothetical protein